MRFQSTEQYRDEHVAAGLTILRGLIPISLPADLRPATDTVREIGRRQHGYHIDIRTQII